MKSSLLMLWIVLGMFTGSAVPAHALNLVDFGGDYVTSSASVRDYTASGVVFSDSLLRSPADADYYARSGAGHSTNFYGGVQASGGTFAGVSVYSGAPDSILVYMNSLNAPDYVSAVWLWNKADFLNNAGASPTIGATSMYLNAHIAGTSISVARRVVLLQGTNYFISAPLSITTPPYVTSLPDLPALTWYAYNPATSINAVGALATPAVGADGALININAAGVWLRAQSSFAGWAQLYVYGFRMDGYAVPEPLAGLAMLVLCVFAVSTRTIRR